MEMVGGHLTLDHSTGLSPPSLHWLLLYLIHVLPLVRNLPTVGTFQPEIPPGYNKTRQYQYFNPPETFTVHT